MLIKSAFVFVYNKLRLGYLHTCDLIDRLTIMRVRWFGCQRTIPLQPIRRIQHFNYLKIVITFYETGT